MDFYLLANTGAYLNKTKLSNDNSSQNGTIVAQGEVQEFWEAAA